MRASSRAISEGTDLHMGPKPTKKMPAKSPATLMSPAFPIFNYFAPLAENPPDCATGEPAPSLLHKEERMEAVGPRQPPPMLLTLLQGCIVPLSSAHNTTGAGQRGLAAQEITGQTSPVQGVVDHTRPLPPQTRGNIYPPA